MTLSRTPRRREREDKRQRFSIRRFNIGAASVAVSAFFMAGQTAVAADSVTATEVDAQLALEPTATVPETTDSVSAPVSDQAPAATEPVSSEPVLAQNPDQAEPVTETDSQVLAEEPVLATTAAPATQDEPVASSQDQAPAEAVASAPAIATRAIQEGGAYDQHATDALDKEIAGTVTAAEAYEQYVTNIPVEHQLNDSNFTSMVRFVNFIDGNLTEESRAKNGAFVDRQIMVGDTFEEQLFPGYRVRLTVSELAPLKSSLEYKAMAEAIDAANGTDYATTIYNPEATNQTFAGEPAGFVATEGVWYDTAALNGFNTGGQVNRLRANDNGANIGIKFKVEALVGEAGESRPVSIFLTDGESLSSRETVYFTTDAPKGWYVFGEFTGSSEQGSGISMNTPELLGDGFRTNDASTNLPLNDNRYVGSGGNQGSIITKEAYYENPQAYINPYANAGLGTSLTGGFFTYLYSWPGMDEVPSIMTTQSVPFFAADEVSEFGAYVISPGGMQSIMVGVIIADRSDADKTYGQAYHGISAIDGQGEERQEPQLGKVAADPDPIGRDYDMTSFYDDDDRQGINELILADEGERQLAALGLYQRVNKVSDTYTLSILANANGAKEAYVNAWIDFNNDGIFSPEEAAGVQSLSGNQEQTLNLTWNQLDLSSLPEDVTKLALRVRISGSAADLSDDKPAGYAVSGEVEDSHVLLMMPPKGSKETTSGDRGLTQTADLTFTASGIAVEDGVEVRRQRGQANSIPEDAVFGIVDPATGELVQEYIEPGQGRYVIDPASTAEKPVVNFIPDPDFTGSAKGVVVRATDANGLDTAWTGSNPSNDSDLLGQPTWDALYLPTVKDVAAQGTRVETTGPQGQIQTGQPVFTLTDENGSALQQENVTVTGYAFEDGTTSRTVEGEGSYELNPTTGQVTFTPEADFVGPATEVTVVATVTVTNADGKTANFTTPGYYQPTVTPVTTVHVTTDGTVLKPTENGTHPSESFTGYYFTGETRTDDNGNITHVYAPVTTVHVTADGTVLKPTENGTHPSESFTGYYFTGETRTDDNGNITHVYAPVTTVHVAEDGTVLKPTENGTHPSESFTGYYFTGETRKDDKGNITHVYAPVTTAHVTADGTVLKPTENGTHPSESFTGYYFTGQTTTDKDGHTTHVYSPVTTVHVTEDGTVLKPTENGTHPSESFTGYYFTGQTTTDKDGHTTHVYAPVTTVHVTADGTVLKPTENGTHPSESFTGYYFTGETRTDDKGHTTHVYAPVTTVHVTADGTVLKPTENGTHPSESFTGYYFTGETRTDEKGHTTHVYAPVTTVHVTTDGTVLKPTENGTHPSESFTGYYFTGETRTDDKGHTTHVYAPVTTVHVTEDGTVLKPTENGTHPSESFPGYYFTGETRKDDNSNITHVYAPVTTVHVTEDGTVLKPTENGTHPSESFTGYYFTGETRTDDKGNITHVYAKVEKPQLTVSEPPRAPQVRLASPVSEHHQSEVPQASPAQQPVTKVGSSLPQTGDKGSLATLIGTGILVAGLGLLVNRRKNS